MADRYILNVSGCNQDCEKHFDNYEDAYAELQKAKRYYISGGFIEQKQCRADSCYITLYKNIFDNVSATLYLRILPERLSTKTETNIPWDTKDA